MVNAQKFLTKHNAIPYGDIVLLLISKDWNGRDSIEELLVEEKKLGIESSISTLLGSPLVSSHHAGCFSFRFESELN